MDMDMVSDLIISKICGHFTLFYMQYIQSKMNDFPNVNRFSSDKYLNYDVKVEMKNRPSPKTTRGEKKNSSGSKVRPKQTPLIIAKPVKLMLKYVFSRYIYELNQVIDDDSMTSDEILDQLQSRDFSIAHLIHIVCN